MLGPVPQAGPHHIRCPARQLRITLVAPCGNYRSRFACRRRDQKGLHSVKSTNATLHLDTRGIKPSSKSRAKTAEEEEEEEGWEANYQREHPWRDGKGREDASEGETGEASGERPSLAGR